MTIPRDRIRARWTGEITPEEAELAREEVELARRLNRSREADRSMDARLSYLLETIESFGPEAVDPDPAGNWDRWRGLANNVKDHFAKRRGRKVPPRLDPIVAEIRARLAALSQFPVIPGTRWAELRSILDKVAVFRQDKPKA
jgi:hypothetical protein